MYTRHGMQFCRLDEKNESAESDFRPEDTEIVVTRVHEVEGVDLVPVQFQPVLGCLDGDSGLAHGVGRMNGDLSATLSGQLVEAFLDRLGEFFVSEDVYRRLQPVDPVRTWDPTISDGFGGEALEAGEAPGKD